MKQIPLTQGYFAMVDDEDYAAQAMLDREIVISCRVLPERIREEIVRLTLDALKRKPDDRGLCVPPDVLERERLENVHEGVDK